MKNMSWIIDKSLPKFLRCELWTYKAIFTQHANPEIMKLSGVYLKMMWTVQQFQIISYFQGFLADQLLASHFIPSHISRRPDSLGGTHQNQMSITL